MIEELFTILSSALYENYWMALVASFGWGLLSILLSPCHLSSIPLIIGFLNTQGKISSKKTFYLSLVFSVGILITIALVGVITAFMGRLIGDIGNIGNYLVAIVFFITGFYLLNIINLPWEKGNLKKTKLRGLPAALILGLLFGVALGPCTFAFMAPVLGVVFTMASENIVRAGFLILLFGLGHCSVIVGAGTVTKKVQDYLNWSENAAAVSWIKKVCGILVIIGGIYLIYSVS